MSASPINGSSFISSLGAVFDFATKDIHNKLAIIDEHLSLDSVNYATIQKMVEFEMRTGRYKTKQKHLEPGKPLPNGCRTVLRLHRALNFIKLLLDETRRAPIDADMDTIAWNAYQETLGTHHPWIIQKTVHAAIKLTAPSREMFIEKLLQDRKMDELVMILADLVQACDTIDKTTEDLFKTNNLLNLV
ncbi:unnamed protein product [Didymodactylos carnosus]|uniref:Glycolipid transfer protein domain-containing protein n=1 Tax=Didymodactylos carnosus TaxID=1234261 RepID=A0A813XBB8_9BILA|nr:unnamed protein product [Didymodactylos carnosus]CAF1044512.1 unnamed protein product [Didymodactylos carnosus]CAF3650582.1 unnamed protein product [Didymodactylos carnosus]CAF3812624.1 unnamed protein product [Didymodactylos carnosus]